jgi:hypothetical protein
MNGSAMLVFLESELQKWTALFDFGNFPIH